MIVLKCDRCGAVSEERAEPWNNALAIRQHPEIDGWSYVKSQDLCPACSQEHDEWLKMGPKMPSPIA